MKGFIIRTTGLIVLIAAAFGAALGSVPVASAADFTVDSTADAADAVPGDGVCDDGAGNCTLRAAIQETNALAGADTITLPAGTYTLTIAGPGEDAAATGDLDITDDLTLTGAGAASTIIDGGALDRVVHVDPVSAGITVGISGVTITNGMVAEIGAGVLVGGFVATTAALTVSDSTITNNVAMAANDGGGIYARGGMLTISETTIINNEANNGGGIVNESATLTLDGSTVSGNTVAGEGGGIWVYHGAVAVTTSTVSGNVAGFRGGGIANDDTLALINSTVSGNTAGPGGGIYSTGVLTTVNSTVSDNAGDPGGIQNEGGSVELKNTIVANNQAGADCQGTITSIGNNLDSDGSCGLAAAGDLSSTDPQLGPLADNGGPTQTHALLAGSPAIDAGDDMACPTVDQRDVARPLDGDGDSVAVCDIGAYEADYVPATPTPTSTSTPPNDPTPTPTVDEPGLPNAGTGDGDSGENAAVWLIALLASAGAVTAAGYGALSRRRR